VPLLLMPIVALAFTLVGCGTSIAPTLTGPQQLAAHAVEGFMADVGRGEPQAACALLTDHARRQLATELGVAGISGGDSEGACLTAVQIATSSYTPTQRRGLSGIRVLRVRVKGDRAWIAPRDTRLPSSIADLRVNNGRGSVLIRGSRGWQIDDMG
jgi:hypothetical protein